MQGRAGRVFFCFSVPGVIARNHHFRKRRLSLLMQRHLSEPIQPEMHTSLFGMLLECEKLGKAAERASVLEEVVG